MQWQFTYWNSIRYIDIKFCWQKNGWKISKHHWKWFRCFQNEVSSIAGISFGFDTPNIVDSPVSDGSSINKIFSSWKLFKNLNLSAHPKCMWRTFCMHSLTSLDLIVFFEIFIWIFFFNFIHSHQTLNL